MGRGVPAPRVEGRVPLADGRRIGFAEYGVPDGRTVFWFHGTPGARRQVPVPTRQAAEERGLRLIALERPGVGGSSPHLYEALVEWAPDVEQCADRLGVDRFGLVGLSGGGPYVLACAHELPDRTSSGVVLGGVAPTQGDDAVPGGLVGLAARFRPLLEATRAPTGWVLWTTARLLTPVASPVFDLYVRTSPEGDQRVFSLPGMKEMFLDDLLRGSQSRFVAPVLDVVLFSRDWGFSLGDVKVPVHFLHGDADNIVPLDHGRHLAKRVPGASLEVRPGDGHLGNLDAAGDVLDAILADW